MERITISTSVNQRVETIWNAYNSSEDIMQWNQASDDWHCTSSTNDLRVGGKFKNRMEAKDGSMGFDLSGTYDLVKQHEALGYKLDDGRKVMISFEPHGDTTKITESFEAESTNPVEMQQAGWQAILDNFKKYTEADN